MVGLNHRLNGHESEQTLGYREGQGSLVCSSPRGHKELDMTEQENNNLCLRMCITQLYPTLCDPTDCSPTGPLSMGFSRQEYWSVLPWPPPCLQTGRLNIVKILVLPSD